MQNRKNNAYYKLQLIVIIIRVDKEKLKRRRKKMKLIIGKTSGFCMGVKRAVDEATKEVEKNQGKVTYCLGELVHNPQVIQNLEQKGLQIIEKLEDIPDPKGKKVIFRAHGVTKQVYEEAEQLGLVVADFSCPKVLAIHEIAKQYVQKGIPIFLIGEKEHPEVIGTASFCGENYFVIQNEEGLQEAIQKVKGKINQLLVIAQTTFNLQKFEQFIETISKELQGVTIEVKNTICDATRLRQEETSQLSKNVDCKIVIGGKKSSNSNKLYQIAKANCNNTFFIENLNDLENMIQKEGKTEINFRKYATIGMMAGASTPEQSVQEVVCFLEKQ